MTVNLSMFAGAGQQFFDNNGVVLAGGLIYTYGAGTTTPLASYTTSSGSIAHTNPIVLDSGGRVAGGEIWLTDAVNYKFVLKNSSGTTIQTYDNISGNGSGISAGIYAALAASSGSSLIGYIEGDSGSTARTVQSKLRESISVKDFGAVGDGTTDDTTAITTAIAAAQTKLSNLYFPAGTYVISSTIALSGYGISFIGAQTGSLQQGSQLPQTTLKWTGSATAMFTISGTYFRFVGMSVQNYGTATDFMSATSTQTLYFEDMSFVPKSGSTRFSRSIFYSYGNNYGYSKWVRNQFQNSAPAFIYIDSSGTGNGITQMEIDGGLFESNSLGTSSVLYFKAATVTNLHIHDATFNQNTYVQTIVDTSDTPNAQSLINFTFDNNEVDTASGPAGYRFNLSNVYNSAFNNNYFQLGGSAVTVANLTNSVVNSFNNNYAQSCGGPFFTADATSRVSAGTNNFVTGNTQGIVNGTATGSGLIPLTYGATVLIKGNLGNASGTTIFKIDVTDASNWTLSYNNPTNGYVTRGQVIGVMVKNISGGAMGVISVVASIKVSAAFPSPANGYSRTLMFVYDGAALIEIGRTAADVPN